MNVEDVRTVIESGGLGGVLVLAIVALMYMVKRFVDFLESSLKAQNDERALYENRAIIERDKRDGREQEERKEWRRIIDEHTSVSKQMYVQMEAMNRAIETLGRRIA